MSDFPRRLGLQSAWQFCVAANLPLPLLCGWQLIERTSYTGMYAGIAVTYLSGFAMSLYRPALVWRAIVGSIVVALCQTILVVHAFVGFITLTISGLFFSFIQIPFRASPHRFPTDQLVPDCVACFATILTGFSLIMVSLLIAQELDLNGFDISRCDIHDDEAELHRTEQRRGNAPWSTH